MNKTFIEEKANELAYYVEGHTFAEIETKIAEALTQNTADTLERVRRFFETSSDDWSLNSENWIKLDEFLTPTPLPESDKTEVS